MIKHFSIAEFNLTKKSLKQSFSVFHHASILVPLEDLKNFLKKNQTIFIKNSIQSSQIFLFLCKVKNIKIHWLSNKRITERSVSEMKF